MVGCRVRNENKRILNFVMKKKTHRENFELLAENNRFDG